MHLFPQISLHRLLRRGTLCLMQSVEHLVLQVLSKIHGCLGGYGGFLGEGGVSGDKGAGDGGDDWILTFESVSLGNPDSKGSLISSKGSLGSWGNMREVLGECDCCSRDDFWVSLGYFMSWEFWGNSEESEGKTLWAWTAISINKMESALVITNFFFMGTVSIVSKYFWMSS